MNELYMMVTIMDRKFTRKFNSFYNEVGLSVSTVTLGAGTASSQILDYFGFYDEISSPTFTIVNEYKGDKDIYHFDVYRLSDSDEFFAIGGEEYFEKGACIIEWGEMIQDVLPKDYIHITFEKDENDVDFRKNLCCSC